MVSQQSISVLHEFVQYADVPRLRKNLNLLLLESEKFRKSWSDDDRDDYFFLYNFLESLPPDNSPPS